MSASPGPEGDPASRRGPRRGLGFVFDRTLILFAGVGVGLAIGLAFNAQQGGGRPAAPVAAPAPAKVPARTPAAPAPPADCAEPIPARLLQRVRAGQPVTVGVFGDSFGDGIWAALYRRLGKDKVRVLKMSEEGTGFTRYQVENLQDKAVRQLGADPVDVAVLVFGANDTQGLFDDAHKHAYALLSPGWKAVYAARLRRFVGVIRDQGAMVYWVGLPKMRQPSYDSDVAALEAFYAEQMAALNVPYLPTRDLSVDPNGQFSLYLADPAAGGAPRLMRANDGVHMTMSGYERLANPLIDRIHAYLARAAATAALESPPSPAQPATAGRRL